MKNPFLFFAGLFGLLGVAAGAFGAHALKGSMPADLLEIFQTGSTYAKIHAVALLAVAVLFAVKGERTERSVRIAGWAYIVGIFIFAGTLWTLALTGGRWLGAITPIGGLSLMIGWGCLAWTALSSGKFQSPEK